MKEALMTTMMIVLITAICIVVLGFAIATGAQSGYKQGQIDCINGNIKYELVTQPDSTKVWQKIEE